MHLPSTGGVANGTESEWERERTGGGTHRACSGPLGARSVRSREPEPPPPGARTALVLASRGHAAFSIEGQLSALHLSASTYTPRSKNTSNSQVVWVYNLRNVHEFVSSRSKKEPPVIGAQSRRQISPSMQKGQSSSEAEADSAASNAVRRSAGVDG